MTLLTLFRRIYLPLLLLHTPRQQKSPICWYCFFDDDEAFSPLLYASRRCRWYADITHIFRQMKALRYHYFSPNRLIEIRQLSKSRYFPIYAWLPRLHEQEYIRRQLTLRRHCRRRHFITPGRCRWLRVFHYDRLLPRHITPMPFIII